jgi:hypothetical protein
MLQYIIYGVMIILGLIVYNVPFTDNTDPEFDSKFNTQQDVAVILMAVSNIVLGLYLLWKFRGIFRGIFRSK